MSDHDESRRAFLVGTAAGVGAVAGAALVQSAEAAEMKLPEAAMPGHAPAMVMSHTAKHGAFLNDEDAATIDAFAERLMPGAPDKPGAREAGVLNYIDLALAGAYSDQQDFYRRGLTQLESYCEKKYGASFRRLPAAKQDEVITALEGGKAEGFTYPSATAFFDRVRTHTMEGMFADPIYGGNKDFAGWRLVGFPGAQESFSPADLQSRQAFTRLPITGLQAQAQKNAMRKG